MPKISMDCAEVNDGSEREVARKLIVGRDGVTKHTFCHLVLCKGLGDERAVGKVLKSIGETGHAKLILKTDGEPAIVQVQEEIEDMREHDAVLENPPV